MTHELVRHLRQLQADGVPVKTIVLDYQQFSESAIRDALAGRSHRKVYGREVSGKK
jgi:hypothetical protein